MTSTPQSTTGVKHASLPLFTTQSPEPRQLATADPYPPFLPLLTADGWSGRTAGVGGACVLASRLGCLGEERSDEMARDVGKVVY